MRPRAVVRRLDPALAVPGPLAGCGTGHPLGIDDATWAEMSTEHSFPILEGETKRVALCRKDDGGDCVHVHVKRHHGQVCFSPYAFSRGADPAASAGPARCFPRRAAPGSPWGMPCSTPGSACAPSTRDGRGGPS